MNKDNELSLEFTLDFILKLWKVNSLFWILNYNNVTRRDPAWILSNEGRPVKMGNSLKACIFQYLMFGLKFESNRRAVLHSCGRYGMGIGVL